MFVADAARGRGAGHALLRRIEETARREGVRVLSLETGIRNAEALALYRRAGFRERGPFGSYLPDPLSVFMEKRRS
jgi:ribosomal protein S18 acetylase RimI-like enzyme